MDDFMALMRRRPKKEYQEASVPGLANLVFEVSGELVGRVICDLPVHEGIHCDGIFCLKKAEDDRTIRGNRFTCLECDDTDFCETCVLSPDNAHDPGHQLLKTAPPSECAVCRDMNIPETREGYKEYASGVEVFQRVAEEKRCGHCAFVWALFSQFPPEEGWPPIKEKVTIRFRRHAYNCFEFSVLSNRGKTTTEDERFVHTIQKVEDSEYSLQLGPMKTSRMRMPKPKRPLQELLLTLEAPNQWALLETGLKTAVENHTECNIASKDSLPTRLVELRTEEPNRVFLLDTTGLVSADYAALSYCWGTGEKGVEATLAKLREFQEDGLVIEDLPATVRDAVRIAETLGLRYLWIDRLCIVQDDEDDWNRESSKMCSIYEGAVLTISADGSTSVWDGILRYQDYAAMEYQPFLENILVMKRQYHKTLEGHISGKTQPLHVRAWTLQERLMSRRILHFTSNELVWECNRKCECECRRQSKLSYRRLMRRHLGDMDEIFSEWRAVVMDYTSRSLTKDFDKFPALSGLVTKFQNSLRQVGGSSDAYLAGLWCSNLADELSWKTPTTGDRETWLRNNPPSLPASDSIALEDDGERVMSRIMRQLTINDWRRPKNYVAPSWSWASVRGPISYLGCEPPAPVKSYIDLIKTSLILKSELQPNGQIMDASITLRGYVARDLQLSAMQGVFASKDGTESIKEIIFITAGDEYILEFVPDDPAGVVRKYGGNIHSVMLLLLGSRDILLGRPLKITGLSLEEVRVSKIKKGGLGLEDSGGGDSLPASEEESPSDDSAEIDQDLREVFRIENDGIVPEGEITRWSSYLVLAPCSDIANKYVRLGCFDTGLRTVDREVMEGVFRNAKREEITIV